MATTLATPQSSKPKSQSQKIRIGIGLSKKRMTDTITKIEELETESKIKKYNTTDLLDELFEITDLGISLSDELHRMKSLTTAWTTLIQSDPEEDKVHIDYIKRLGDYRLVQSKAESTLIELRKRHDLVMKLHKNQATEECDYPNFDTYEFLEKQSPSPITTVNTAPTATANTAPTATVNTAPSATVNTTPNTTVNTTQTVINSPPSNITHQLPQLNVRLPDIHLPKFSGNFVEFLHYFELFTSMIDSQPIDTTVKFHYLKTSLEGEALSLIEHLPTNANNYQIARDLLKNNYGDTTRIRHFLLRELQDLSPVINPTNTAQLHHLWSTASRHFHQLCKLQPEADNNILTDVIMRKLPKKVISKIMSKHPSLQTVKASELLNEVHQFIQAETLLISIFDQPNNPHMDRKITTMSAHSQNRSKPHPQRQPTQSNSGSPQIHQTSSQSNAITKPPSPCIFCTSIDNQHRYEACPTHTTGEQRTKRARELSLCLKCLRPGHETRNCRRTFPCKHCSKANHHSVLCFRHYPSHHQQTQSTHNTPPNPRQSSHHNGNTSQRQQGPQPHRPPFNQSHRPPYNRNTHLNITSDSTNVDDHNNIQDNIVMTINATPTSHHLSYTSSTPLPPFRSPVDANIPIIDNTNNSTDQNSRTQRPTTKEVTMMATKLPVIDANNLPRPAVIMLDSGSNQSYISTEFAKQLSIQSTNNQVLNVHTFGNKNKKRLSTKQYNIDIQLNDELIPIQVTEIPLITNSINVIPLDSSTIDSPIIQKLLNNINCQLPREELCPDLLIGLDHMHSILGSSTSTILPNGLTLHNTKCGIILSGKEDQTAVEKLLDLDHHKSMCYQQSTTNIPIDINDSTLSSENKALSELLERFWLFEGSSPESKLSTDEHLAAAFYQKTTYRTPDGRYVIRWPYKDEKEKFELPNNHHLAYHRLQHLLKKLKMNQDTYQQYDAIIKDQLHRQFIEVVEDEQASDGEIIHYISHHAVYKQTSKTTKVRIVFDASARATKHSKSLNEALHTGEQLLPLIPSILTRIRHEPILISSDLEKAFLQLELDIRDRDACRFLWQHPDASTPTVYRFRRMPFGIKTSPYLLNKTIKKHLTDHPSELNTKMLHNCYVDNIFLGVQTVEEGKQFFHDSRATFHTAQMNLTQFVSNSSELNTFFSEQLHEDQIDPNQKILGIPWNIERDTFILHPIKPIQNIVTKRKVLSTIASTYDPTGFQSPSTLLGKLFFQRLWKETKNWDQPLQPHEIDEWKTIEKKLEGPPIEINRRYFSTPNSTNANFELHIFSDASEHAYGAVAYIRRIQDNIIETAFVQSKSRVSPVNKQLSIPMLELLAIQQAATMCSSIINTIGITITKTYVWSDSLAMIDCIHNNKTSSLFARNRLRNIKLYAPHAVFSHIPGKINPADLLTRGCSFSELANNKRWWNGPSFLLDNQLPIRESSIIDVTTTSAVTQQSKQLLDPFKFSSFRRLLHVMVFILKFIYRNLSDDKLRDKAKTKLLFLAQQIDPPDEATIRHLKLFQEDNIWYFQGRLPTSKIAFLPRGHIAKLFVLELHKVNNHSSTIYTLSQVRNETWIPRGLSFVKKALKNCPQCCMRKSLPCHQPDFPDYPNTRTTWSSPFSHCGFDYLGPLQLRTNNGISKCWVILFTCLQTRYTSIQMTKSLSTEHLLNALRRFTAIYGVPDSFYTDNAAQIKLLRDVIEEVRGQQQRNRISSINLPTFKFIAAYSPWSGGIYERIVGIFKNCLQKSYTTKSLLDEDSLLTILVEAESIINDRPITFTSSDNEDPTPIRPCDLVFPNKKRSHLLTVSEDIDTTTLKNNSATLLEHWMRLSSLTQHFQDRWRKEYLQLLQSRTQTEHQQKKNNWTNDLKEGQIVLIEDDTDKIKWDLGRVIEVSERSAKLKNARTNRTIERPKKALYPIEVTPIDKDEESETLSAVPNRNKSQQPTTTLTRQPIRRSPRFTTPSTSLLIMLTVACLLHTTQADNTISAVHSTSNHSTLNETSINSSTASIFTRTINEIQKTIYQLKITLIIFGIIITISSLLNFTSAMLKFINLLFTIIKNITRCICTIIRACCHSMNHERRRTGRTVIMAIFISFHIKSMKMCDDTAHLTAPDNVCYINGNQTQCSINTVSLLNVRANGTTTCLSISTNKTNILKVKIKAQSIINVCNKQTLFFSRDFQLNYEYSHRCAEAGSCTSNTCSNVRDDHDLPEISSKAKQSPGYTRCTASCGCITCNGCFFCSPSCLFYRYYAVPISTTIYEISTCPSWTTKIRIVITVDDKQLEIDLSPGIKQQIPGTNISLTATSLHSPPSNIHSRNFITAISPYKTQPIWVAATTTPVVSHGMPIRGTLGELLCSTREDADSFNCKFDKYQCACDSFEAKILCKCSAQLLKDHNTKERLPLLFPNQQVVWSNEERNIHTVSTQTSVSTLQLEIENATITRETRRSKCIATQQSLQGCFNCEEGSQLKMTCDSEDMIQATVRCDEGRIVFTLSCGNSISNEVKIHANREAVLWTCIVDCGIPTITTISGELQFSPNIFLNVSNFASVFERIHQETPSFNELWTTFRSTIEDYVWSPISRILMTVGLLVIGYFITINIIKIYFGRINILRHTRQPIKLL